MKRTIPKEISGNGIRPLIYGHGKQTLMDIQEHLLLVFQSEIKDTLGLDIVRLIILCRIFGSMTPGSNCYHFFFNLFDFALNKGIR